MRKWQRVALAAALTAATAGGVAFDGVPNYRYSIDLSIRMA